MKKYGILIIILLISFSLTVCGFDIEEEIKREVGVDKVEDIVPESLRENDEFKDIDFSYSGASEAVSVNSVINKISSLLSLGIKGEISFIMSAVSVLVLSALLKSFSSNLKNSTFKDLVDFVVSCFVCVFLYSHILKALETVSLYVSELGAFIRALLPFLATLLCFQGGGAEAAGSSAIIITAISIVESVCAKIVLPVSKILFAFICAGFISRLNFSAVTDLATSVASKTCTITMSILTAVMYFQHALSSSADSLALRSIKLAASSFIPIIGGNVSEAAGTLMSGVRLVKSTLGLFAFGVLLYLTAVPVISFLLKKVSMRIISSFASVLGCDDEGKIVNSVSGIYNILSALMFSSSIFFVIALAVFVKSGGF